MKALRTLGLHGAGLVVAAGLAYSAWNSEEEVDSDRSDRVEIWGGELKAIKSVGYLTKDGKVTVELREDDAGPFCVVSSEKDRPKVSVSPPEKLAAEPKTGDAKPKTERSTKRFVSVSGCGKLTKEIAPLFAVRAVGVVPKERLGEFGLDEPKGTLTVRIGDVEHKLTFGGMTPGGGDHYALEPSSGKVYAVAGDTVRLLEYADSRLVERELHTFESDAVQGVEIAAGDKRVKLTKMGGKVDGWAHASSPTAADETSGNWMSKLGRVRLSEFKEKLEPGAKSIVRVAYGSASSALGFVELYRVGEGAAAQYWAKSETTRWFGSVLRSAGEQLEQDLAAVLK